MNNGDRDGYPAVRESLLAMRMGCRRGRGAERHARIGCFGGSCSVADAHKRKLAAMCSQVFFCGPERDTRGRVDVRDAGGWLDHLCFRSTQRFAI